MRTQQGWILLTSVGIECSKHTRRVRTDHQERRRVSMVAACMILEAKDARHSPYLLHIGQHPNFGPISLVVVYHVAA